jgi:hypothetical protein
VVWTSSDVVVEGIIVNEYLTAEASPFVATYTVKSVKRSSENNATICAHQWTEPFDIKLNTFLRILQPNCTTTRRMDLIVRMQCIL